MKNSILFVLALIASVVFTATPRVHAQYAGPQASFAGVFSFSPDPNTSNVLGYISVKDHTDDFNEVVNYCLVDAFKKGEKSDQVVVEFEGQFYGTVLRRSAMQSVIPDSYISEIKVFEAKEYGKVVDKTNAFLHQKPDCIPSSIQVQMKKSGVSLILTYFIPASSAY